MYTHQHAMIRNFTIVIIFYHLGYLWKYVYFNVKIKILNDFDHFITCCFDIKANVIVELLILSGRSVMVVFIYMYNTCIHPCNDLLNRKYSLFQISLEHAPMAFTCFHLGQAQVYHIWRRERSPRKLWGFMHFKGLW